MHPIRRPAVFHSRRVAWTGLAMAAFIAGSILGPSAAAAVTKAATDVFITNDATSPVPVTGTVNVGNLPATQAVSGTVNVGNLPATQAVSGTVNIGSMPAQAQAQVSGGLTQNGLTPASGSSQIFLPGPIKVTSIMFWSSQRAIFTIVSTAVGNGYQVVSANGAPFTQSFYNPIESSSFIVSCEGASGACTWLWAVAGI
jgi:hypothetical protein